MEWVPRFWALGNKGMSFVICNPGISPDGAALLRVSLHTQSVSEGLGLQLVINVYQNTRLQLGLVLVTIEGGHCASLFWEQDRQCSSFLCLQLLWATPPIPFLGFLCALGSSHLPSSPRLHSGCQYPSPGRRGKLLVVTDRPHVLSSKGGDWVCDVHS